MKWSFAVIGIFFALNISGQNLYFPPNNGNTWDTLSPNTLGWCQTRIDSLYSFLESKNSKGFIVLKNGKIVLEKYFGTFTADSIWYWASAGKSLTAVAIGVAQQEGYLNINNPSNQYLGIGFSSCPLEKENLITIKNQLTMTTGFDDDTINSDCTLDSCLIYKADAGTRWAYHNAPYTLLDQVISNATNVTLNQYVSQKISTPIGLNGLFITSNYNNVYYSKTRGLARFGLFILNRGNWNGNQILTDSTYFQEMTNTSQQLNKSYGYLWWLNGKESFMIPQTQFVFNGSAHPDAPDDMISALGKNGQIINVVPSQQLVMIRVGNTPDTGLVPNVFNNELWQKFNLLNCNTTSIEHNNKQNEISINPNPIFNQTTIHSDDIISKFLIFDNLGNLELEQIVNNNHFIFDSSTLINGIYLIKFLHLDGKWSIKKIIVNH